jgi:dimethylhistidine N-methyltransferase
VNAPHDNPVAAAALPGLLAARKTLPPLLFYDEEGCRLFYEITRLPEYYLTRTELALLERIAPDLAAAAPAGSTLVEYGASDETKAAMLLRQTIGFGEPVFTAYIPIDIATPSLLALRGRLEARFPGLTVLPHTADFMRPVTLPARAEGPVLGFFPGSTIGNLEPGEATDFLRRARATLGPEARLILGFDCCQDPARLIPAYDDAAGVTAAFNRNLLVRLNREAGATFDPDGFVHRALWNAAEGRIEMHLISPDARAVQVAGRAIRFAAGETIHTENSYKYRPDRMRGLAAAAGWTPERTWTDPDGLFAIWLLR